MKQIRILKRDLVYVSGLPSSLANEKMLGSKEFFGQYGKIKQIMICKQKAINSDTFKDYIYITY